ncbi:MAG: hypothetical protein HYW47_07985 [Deltaproteobacteria bacterium]|nr:hypothetical protein [Deltaproteobacteria bacterium]
MKKYFVFYVFLSSIVYAAPPLDPTPYSSRYEYKLGVHVNGGGSTGIIGMSADWSAFEKYAFLLKAGTGVYFSSAAFEIRRFLFETSLAPYFSLGVTRWEQTGAPEKLKNMFPQSVDLGLVNSDGTQKNAYIYLSTASLGLHYLSDYGFSAAVELTGLFSYATTTFKPWAGLSLGWYF